MPNPIEPSPMTAMRFCEADSGMRRSLFSLLGSRITRLGRAAKAWDKPAEEAAHERNQMNETRLREEICRLGRSLFERGLTPGSSGNISVRTRRRRLAGDADQCLARLARSGAAVAARRRRQARLRRCADQGSAAAHRAVPDPQRRARGGASAFDPFGGAVDAAGDRSARRTAADDGLLSDEVRRHRAGAVLSAGRSRGGRCDQGPRRKICIGAARQSRPGGIGRYAGGRGIRDRGTGRDRETLSAAARAEPALSDAGADRGFVEDVRA